MPVFRLNEPISTDRPYVTVDAGLPPGEYRFRLVVVDSEGRESKPDEKVVMVVKRLDE